MPFPRRSRVKLVWGLELALGLELYACAVLALHSRGLRATPLLAAPGLVIPALVIPPVFYALVALVSVRPLSPWRLMAAVGAMCGVHAMLVAATGALFVIPDLVDYGAAVAFALWGSPAVTMLQLTAAPLVLARLRPLLMAPRSAPRPVTRVVSHSETPAGAPPSLVPREAGATPPPNPVRRARAAVASPAPRQPALTSPAPRPPSEPVLAAAPVTPAVREPVATPAARPALRAPVLISRGATPFATGAVARAAAAPKLAAASAEPMVRVSFGRIADQLPVEMFVRGRKGLNDTIRPGVSLLVPRRLLLPHLADGIAPVKWDVVADQFPRDELKLTHEEIENRLPDGSLLLPLDEVVPQIPAELLALSTPAVDVLGIEEFPPPFQPHVPSSEAAAAVEPDVSEADALNSAAAEVMGPEAAAPAVEESEADLSEADVLEAGEPDAEEPEVQILELEAPGIEVPEADVQELVVQELAAPVFPAPRLAAVEPAESEPSKPPESRESERRIDVAVDRARSAEARRIVALLTPLMNGLEIGERTGAGTPLVTVVPPTLSEAAVVATAVRVVPLLADGRLSEPVSQATLTAQEATIVLTPFESPNGAAFLVTAVASRASLAWLERLARSAAGEPRGAVSNGARSPEGPRRADELRETVVPPSVRELASSLTAFGPVTPTVLRDTVGLFRVCLFLRGSIDARPLAELARDLYGALEGAEVGRVASVILRLGTYRLVMRAVAAASGETTILVGAGPIARPGLARIELDRAAARLATLARG